MHVCSSPLADARCRGRVLTVFARRSEPLRTPLLTPPPFACTPPRTQDDDDGGASSKEYVDKLVKRVSGNKSEAALLDEIPGNRVEVLLNMENLFKDEHAHCQLHSSAHTLTPNST